MADKAVEEGQSAIEHFRAPEFIRKELTEFIMSTGAQAWARAGLEMSQRSLVTISVLASLQRMGALREHVGLGLDNGLGAREICEAILHCGISAGLPVCIEAMEIVHDVFEERGVSG